MCFWQNKKILQIYTHLLKKCIPNFQNAALNINHIFFPDDRNKYGAGAHHINISKRISDMSTLFKQNA